MSFGLMFCIEGGLNTGRNTQRRRNATIWIKIRTCCVRPTNCRLFTDKPNGTASTDSNSLTIYSKQLTREVPLASTHTSLCILPTRCNYISYYYHEKQRSVVQTSLNV